MDSNIEVRGNTVVSDESDILLKPRNYQSLKRLFTLAKDCFNGEAHSVILYITLHI